MLLGQRLDREGGRDSGLAVALGDQLGDAARDRLGLDGASAGDDMEVAVAVINDGLLLGTEADIRRHAREAGSRLEAPLEFPLELVAEVVREHALVLETTHDDAG